MVKKGISEEIRRILYDDVPEILLPKAGMFQKSQYAKNKIFTERYIKKILKPDLIKVSLMDKLFSVESI
jgi:hypothetical protein